MKKLVILLGFVLVASFSAYSFTNHSDKTMNKAKTEEISVDSTKCLKDSTHMMNKNTACCNKKDLSSCCKKDSK
jgi:hypothetical protein